jgi:hypothetical protein
MSTPTRLERLYASLEIAKKVGNPLLYANIKAAIDAELKKS